MHLNHLALGASLGLSTLATAFVPAPTIDTDILALKALSNLVASQAKKVLSGSTSNCTFSNVAVRREWGSLSKLERKSYTDAVLCLQSKPSLFDRTEVPGAVSRFDDFVAVHINQTLTIHGTANFLSWHRYFVWTYENALRDECGYQGYQPYWNWGKTAFDPVNSPIFDGSDYSMSGNGVPEAHNCTQALPNGLNCIEDAGTGGGCVVTGPFKNMTANLGPISPTLLIPELTAITDFSKMFEGTPRCLRRDVSAWVSSGWSKDSDSASLINNNTDIGSFQDTMQGDFVKGDYGVHAAGHFTIGGDPGGDIYASPGDPVFWLHHGGIDRTWWIWQNQDIETRQNQIAGTITIFNSPPSRNGTLEDVIDMGINGPSLQIKDLTSTVEGPLCYIYI